METKSVEVQLLREFLTRSCKAKRREINRITNDINLIQQDLSFLDSLDNGTAECKLDDYTDPQVISQATSTQSPRPADQSEQQSSSNGDSHEDTEAILSRRRRKMLADFHCLDDCYLSTRRLSGVKKPTSSEPAESPEAAKDVQMTAPIKWSSPPEGLELFAKSLTKFTQYTELRRLSTISSVSDMLNEPGLVSTIEFDRDNEYFAISGADMRIKMFEYSNVIRNDVTTHYPITEIPCRAKVSSVSWSNYHKGMLASSDYEGSVTLWDAYRAQRIRTFQEHERRCWSVHFNNVDTNMLASGSDDTSVKLWAPNTPHSVTSIPSKFSVCSVRFNPESRFHLAVGSADHCVHYYDLRSCKTALNVFMGHRKSVSYVKFLNAGELVSASADSQLKLWKTDDPRCLRTFKGHINERMFVGLSTGGDYIACGSENNSLYVYYKGLSTEVQTWSFSTLYGGARTYANNVGLPGEVQDFVSSVCWMPGTDVVMAANSRGTIQLLELV